MENNQQESFLRMDLDYDGGRILRETVRWSRFLSIVGIVMLAFCLLAFILSGSVLLAAISRLAPGFENLEGALGTVFIVVIVIFFGVFGYLVYMLYRFSVLTRRGIETQDQAVFSEGMKCLKVYFIIGGILSVLGLLSNLLSLTKLF